MHTIESIEEKIKGFVSYQFIKKLKEIKLLPELLQENEELCRAIAGIYNNGQGLLIATNKRLLFIDKGFVALKTEDFPICNVSSVQFESGMIMGSVKIYCSGNTAKITHIEKDSAKEFASYVSERLSISKEDNQSPSSKSSESITELKISQLERLAKLKEQGILTEEEFSTEKTKILSLN